MATQDIFNAVIAFDEATVVAKTQAFADQIGADGYSADAPGAVKLVKQLVG